MCAVSLPLPFLISTSLEKKPQLARSLSLSLSYTHTQMDHGGGGREMSGEEAADSTNQKTESFKNCSSSSSMKKFYPIDSPFKKRKPQYELSDPRLALLKYKFQDRLTWQEDESTRTESLGCDGIFIDKNCDTDMVNIVEALDSCENTQSLLGGCIEVDSINGIESQSMRKMLKVGAPASSSSSNNISSDAFSSSHSCGTKETDSWVMQHLEHDHQGLMLQPYDDDIERLHDVIGQYNCLMKNEIASGDVDDSAANIMDEKLYSNGVDDFLIMPAGKTGCHDERKLTIDQEFEQYFSKLML